MSRTRILALATLVLALLPTGVAAQPRLDAPVTDLANALSSEQEAQMTQKLTTFRTSSGVDVAVLVVPSTAPLSLEDYSMRVATRWRQRLPGTPSAVLYVLAVQDRRHRLEVNDVARARLSDTRAREVLDAARPALRQDDWGGAVRTVMDGVLTALAPAASPPSGATVPSGTNTLPSFPNVPTPPAPHTAAPVTPASPGESLCLGGFCALSVLLVLGFLVSLLVLVLRKAGRAVARGLSGGGTTYGHQGVLQAHGHGTTDHDSDWSTSGIHDHHHTESVSSWSSGDASHVESSSSGSSGDTSHAGGGFSGGGASSDW